MLLINNLETPEYISYRTPPPIVDTPPVAGYEGEISNRIQAISIPSFICSSRISTRLTKVNQTPRSDCSVSTAVSKQSSEDNHDSLQQLSDLIKSSETVIALPSPVINELCGIGAHFEPLSNPLYLFPPEEAEVHELRSCVSHYLGRKELGKAESALLKALNAPNKLEVRLQCLLLSDLADVQAAQSRQDESITSRRQAVVLFEEKYGYAALDTLQYTESLAQALVMKQGYKEAEALYRKAADAYDKIHLTERRLSSQFSIAQLLQMTGHMEQAVQLFSSTLIEQIECGSATDISSLSSTIGTLCFLRASYTKLGRNEEWEMLNSKLNQILKVPMGLLGSLDIFDDGMVIAMSIADYYSSRDDLDTAERIFRCGLEKLRLLEDSPQSAQKRAKVFQLYAKHLHRQGDNIQSASYLLSALEAIVPYDGYEGTLDDEFSDLMSQVWAEVERERSALTIGLFQQARDLEARVTERRQRVQMVLEPLPNVIAVGYSTTEPQYPSMDFVVPGRDWTAVPKALNAIAQQKLDNDDTRTIATSTIASCRFGVTFSSSEGEDMGVDISRYLVE
jgi:tetratricopeptide (TPR) repeat protein